MNVCLVVVVRFYCNQHLNFTAIPNIIIAFDRILFYIQNLCKIFFSISFSHSLVRLCPIRKQNWNRQYFNTIAFAVYQLTILCSLHIKLTIFDLFSLFFAIRKIFFFRVSAGHISYEFHSIEFHVEAHTNWICIIIKW